MLLLQASQSWEFHSTPKPVAVPFSACKLSSSVVITLSHNPPLLDCPEDFGHCFIPNESISCCTCLPELLHGKINMVFLTPAAHLEIRRRQCCVCWQHLGLTAASVNVLQVNQCWNELLWWIKSNIPNSYQLSFTWNAVIHEYFGLFWPRVPDFVREKRFGNWLKDARDWAISRNRYWGTPIPLWVSHDLEEVSEENERYQLPQTPVYTCCLLILVYLWLLQPEVLFPCLNSLSV